MRLGRACAERELFLKSSVPVLTRRGPRGGNTCATRDAQVARQADTTRLARLLRRFACCAVSRVATFHALRSYIYSSAVRLMCPGPPADLPSAYPYLAFTRKTTNLPLCGRTHRLLIVHLGSVNLTSGGKDGGINVGPVDEWSSSSVLRGANSTGGGRFGAGIGSGGGVGGCCCVCGLGGGHSSGV